MEPTASTRPDQGDLALAATCFENAIHLCRAETEEYNHKALRAIKKIAKQLSEPYRRHVQSVR